MLSKQIHTLWVFYVVVTVFWGVVFCFFLVSTHSGTQISLVSWVITVDLIESCHISAVNGLRVEAAEVKGFLKGQLTHQRCLPPSALPTHTS